MESDPEEPCFDTAEPSYKNDLAIVSLVLQQMTLLEARLLARLDENAKVVAGRWDHHEQEHRELSNKVHANTLKIDRLIKEDEADDIAYQARIGPIKAVGTWIVREWRTLVIIALIIVNFIGALLDRARLLGS